MKDEEGGKSENDEKRLCTMKWKEELEEVVLMYTKERKEKKGKKRKEYLPRLSDDLPGNRCMFYLCFGGVQRIDHKLELSPRAHYIVKPSKNEVMRILEEENVFMNYRWLSRSLVILALKFTCTLNKYNQGKVEEEEESKTNVK